MHFWKKVGKFTSVQGIKRSRKQKHTLQNTTSKPKPLKIQKITTGQWYQADVESAQYPKGKQKMSLEALLTIEEPTNKDFAREIDVEFFEHLAGKVSKKTTEKRIVKQFQEYVNTPLFNPLPLREHLKNNGVLDLRHIVKSNRQFANISQGTGRLLGLWQESQAGPEQRRALIKHEILESKLENIPQRSEIIQHMLTALRSTARDYLNPNIVGQEIAQANKQYIIQSGEITTYLRNNGILDLRHIVKSNRQFTNTSPGLGSLLGLWQGKQVGPEQRRALIKHEILESKLENIPQRSEIIQHMLTSPNSTARDYLNPNIVGQEIAQANKQYIIQSGEITTYLRNNGVLDLRHLTQNNNQFTNISHGLGSLLGLWQGKQVGPEQRRALIKHEILESKLENIPQRSEIIQHMLTHTSRTARDYLHPNIVGEEAAQANMSAVLESEAFQTYCRERNIPTEELCTHPGTRKIFPNQVTQAPTPQVSPRSRMIQTEWTKEQTEQLRKHLTSGFFERLQDHPEMLEEEFGRSLSAIISKAYHLLGKRTKASNSNGGFSDIRYPFPPIHEEHEAFYQKNLHVYLANIARALQNNLQPEVVPALGYFSPVTFDNGMPQLIHITMPILYKGIGIESYTPSERKVMEAIANNLELARDPRILQRQTKEGNTLSQLFERTPLIKPNTLDEQELTKAIPYATGREVWQFIAPPDASTYQNTKPSQGQPTPKKYHPQGITS